MSRGKLRNFTEGDFSSSIAQSPAKAKSYACTDVALAE